MALYLMLSNDLCFGQNKANALVQFSSASQAASACENLDHIEMFGRVISVVPSKHTYD